MFGKSKRPYSYPLNRTNDRVFSEGWTGRLYTWDIDKTYLATEIHSLSGLLAVPFEFAIDKRNVAGTGALLRALRRGMAPWGETEDNPIYFVSASPPELRRVIQRKMLLDGVAFDGITFKDQLALIRRAKFGKLREQIGYKLSALLLNRRELPWGAAETLFGDDSESDALIYSIYADITAGRLRGARLVATLLRHQVRREDADFVTELAASLPERELVESIFINLEVRRDPRRFAAFGPRLVPCHDSFQAALRLFEDGHITEKSVLSVAEELVVFRRREPPSLLRGAADLMARGAVQHATVAALWPALQAAGFVPEAFGVLPPTEVNATPSRRVAPGAWFTPAEALAPEP